MITILRRRRVSAIPSGGSRPPLYCRGKLRRFPYRDGSHCRSRILPGRLQSLRGASHRLYHTTKFLFVTPRESGKGSCPEQTGHLSRRASWYNVLSHFTSCFLINRNHPLGYIASLTFVTRSELPILILHIKNIKKFFSVSVVVRDSDGRHRKVRKSMKRELWTCQISL